MPVVLRALVAAGNPRRHRAQAGPEWLAVLQRPCSAPEVLRPVAEAIQTLAALGSAAPRLAARVRAASHPGVTEPAARQKPVFRLEVTPLEVRSRAAHPSGLRLEARHRAVRQRVVRQRAAKLLEALLSGALQLVVRQRLARRQVVWPWARAAKLLEVLLRAARLRVAHPVKSPAIAGLPEPVSRRVKRRPATAAKSATQLGARAAGATTTSPVTTPMHARPERAAAGACVPGER